MKPDLKVLKREDAPKPPQDEKQSPAQSEMPFAVVDGEPVTALPQDLYIPPYALQVFLEAFEGPLDLLLYLIRRQNIDILDIPIAEITQQYVQYIELMKEMQLELAGEYLLMAAMMGVGVVTTLLAPEPRVLAKPNSLRQAVIDPFVEYFSRRHALLVLAFIVLYPFAVLTLKDLLARHVRAGGIAPRWSRRPSERSVAPRNTPARRR